MLSCLVGVIVRYRCPLDASLKDTRYAIDLRRMSADNKAFNTIVTTVAAFLVAALRIDKCLLDWELRRLIAFSAVRHDVREVSVEMEFEIGL